MSTSWRASRWRAAPVLVVGGGLVLLAACGGPSHAVSLSAPLAPATHLPQVLTESPTPAPPPTPHPSAVVHADPVRHATEPTPAPTVRKAVTPKAAPTRVKPTTPVAKAPSYPVTLDAVGSAVTQAITVTAAGYGDQTATYEAWQRSGSAWRLVFGPWTADVGYNGVAPHGAKREGDGRTPSGVYGFSYMFGIDADPGVHYSWQPVTGTYDVWDDDPASARYNLWTDTRTENAGAAPEPMDNAPFYDYGAVIAYNSARTPGLGSAIFMHVSNGGDTAGCVSLPVSDLLEVLRWMQPGTEISIGVA